MKLKYLIYTITLTSLTACSDFLEPKSQSKYIPKDANALQEMLIGEAYPQQGNTKFLAYLEILADDLDQNQVEGYEFPENEQGKMETFEVLYSWQPNMFEMQQKLGQEPSNTWGNLYEYILGANAALDYTDEVSGTEAEKNYIKAQSYALRAFFYYMLVNQYGLPYNYDKESLGVPLKIDSKMRDEGEVLMKRNTVEEVYLQIVADLNEAERLFLTLSAAQQYEPNYLVSLPMVQLLKSRVALYMENWKEAKTYAEKVIKDWNFSLRDLNTIPAPEAGMKEPYYTFNTYDSPEVIWSYGTIRDLTGEYEGYFEKEGKNNNDTRRKFKAADELINSFSEGDLRKDRYITREIQYNEDVPESSTFYNTYLPYGKYKTLRSVPTSGSSDYFALSFRVAEAYLNYAEAAAMSQAEGEAITTMNALLEKRYDEGNIPSFSGLSGDDLITKIREERRKELCYEGQRWFDLRRYGMPSIQHKWEGKIYTLTKNDPSYVLPIPPNVLQRNLLLEQNPFGPERVGVSITN